MLSSTVKLVVLQVQNGFLIDCAGRDYTQERQLLPEDGCHCSKARCLADNRGSTYEVSLQVNAALALMPRENHSPLREGRETSH